MNKYNWPKPPAALAVLLLFAACQPSPPPAAPAVLRPANITLFTCFHADTCFAALDAVLKTAPGAVIHAVPEDAAEHALAVRLAHLRAANPQAERAVWQALRERWTTQRALGVGPAHGWATPQATGVPLDGIETFEGVVDAAVREYRELGGRDGPVILRDGQPVAPDALAP